MSNPVGRPTAYKEEYAQQLIDYFNKEVVKEILTITEGTGKSQWRKEEKRYEALFFPTLELFANEIGVDDDTLANWANAKNEDGSRKHPEFFGAYTRAKRIQKGLLLQFALIGKLNPGFAQFFAINEYGMQSKSVVENTGEVKHKWEDMTDEQLEAAIEARKNRAA